MTRNRVGQGEAWHIASRNDDRFTSDFLGHLVDALQLSSNLKRPSRANVSVQSRCCNSAEYLFLMNFNDTKTTIELGGCGYHDLENGEVVVDSIELNAYGSRILIKEL